MIGYEVTEWNPNMIYEDTFHPVQMKWMKGWAIRLSKVGVAKASFINFSVKDISWFCQI